MTTRNNILATLAYYDVFDWPLTVEETLAKMVNLEYLNDARGALGKGRPLQGQKLQKELDQLVLDRLVDCACGFYFLAGREHLVPLRLKREKIAKRKWRLARWAVWWLRFVPYVRAVFASGSLAMNNTDELSDLDVLIVVKHGRIWLTRFLVLAVLSFLRMRRKAGDRVAPDQICPNHFITDESLSIPFRSIYTAQTYANLVPTYVGDLTLIEKFREANRWILDYVVGWNLGGEKEVKPPKRGSTSKIGREVELPIGSPTSRRFAEWFLDHFGLGRILENWLRRYQSQRIARNLSNQSCIGHVVFSDEQLAFHPDSIESRVAKNYSEKLADLEFIKQADVHS